MVFIVMALWQHSMLQFLFGLSQILPLRETVLFKPHTVPINHYGVANVCKTQKREMSFRHEKDLDAKLLPYKHHNMRKFVRYIISSRPQRHYPSSSRDTLDSMICLHTVSSYDFTRSLRLTRIPLDRKKVLQNGTHRSSSLLKGLSPNLNLFFTSWAL